MLKNRYEKDAQVMILNACRRWSDTWLLRAALALEQVLNALPDARSDLPQALLGRLRGCGFCRSSRSGSDGLIVWHG